MDKPIKIKEELIERIDAQCDKFWLGSRQNLTNTLIRKGLDFLAAYGYDELLKIPSGAVDEMVQTSK